IYPAVQFDGLDLVDGGVANNTPISDAAELGASKIYVLPTGITCELPTPPRGAVGMLVHAITLLINQRLVGDIEAFSQEAELIVLPPPCPLNVLPSEFSHAGELIEQAYELASTALDHPDPAAYWTPRSLQRLESHSPYPSRSLGRGALTLFAAGTKCAARCALVLVGRGRCHSERT